LSVDDISSEAEETFTRAPDDTRRSYTLPLFFSKCHLTYNLPDHEAAPRQKYVHYRFGPSSGTKKIT